MPPTDFCFVLLKYARCLLNSSRPPSSTYCCHFLLRVLYRIVSVLCLQCHRILNYFCRYGSQLLMCRALQSHPEDDQ